jgi:crossover junction endodeoxyribonuclease RuvC
MLILGLDPGSRHTGYGLVELRGDRLHARAHGRISCPRQQPVPQRLHHIATRLAELLAEWSPEAVALESLFHGLNSRSLIVLAQARGALLTAAAASGVEIVEYSPAEVKAAVTGHGRADKVQVQRMVAMLLSVPQRDLSADAADALALAICYAHRSHMDRLTRRLDARL